MPHRKRWGIRDNSKTIVLSSSSGTKTAYTGIILV